MKINIIDPSSDSRWNDLVEKHPFGCIFHHSAWMEVLEKTFPQLKSFYFIAEDSDAFIRGAIPLFWANSWITGSRFVSLPFSLYCDPLVETQDVFSFLIEDIVEKQRQFGAGFIVIRTRFVGHFFINTNFKHFINYKNHTLSLTPSLETIKRSFHRSCVRQRINRAEQSNITLSEARSESDVRCFYELYCLTRKKIGLPPQPYRFYHNMWEILYPMNMLEILIAKYKDQPVSSLLFLKYKQRAHAEFMGTNDKFLDFSPNIFLFWSAIQKVKAEGYRFFDFGGSAINNLNLIAFKRRWGTVEEDISHYYFPSIKGLSSKMEESAKYKLLTKLSPKLPNRIFKWTGQVLYRHLGG